MASTSSRFSRWYVAGTAGLILLTTLLHYLHGTEAVFSHELFRRLYYLPIIWAALVGGLRVGLTVAGVVTLAYFPHAFLMQNHLDPASVGDKGLEIVLYFGIGALAGHLADSQRRAQDEATQEAVQRAAAEAHAARLEGMVHLTRGLAHEIRNPLAGIQGAMEIIGAAVPDSRPEHEMVEIGLRETARLNQVLTDFLDFARPRLPQLAPFGVAQAVSDVTALFATDSQSRGLQLEGVGPDIWARGDRQQVVQVLVNLVGNAVAMTPPGGRIRVEARAARGNNDKAECVTFRVSDTGPGVPADLGSSIYDPYVTGREGGTGLGLSIATQIIRQHGALLEHTSTNNGAVFSFSLPIQERP